MGSIRKAEIENLIIENNYNLSQGDYDEFKRMFRLHADAGHYLVSSW